MTRYNLGLASIGCMVLGAWINQGLGAALIVTGICLIVVMCCQNGKDEKISP